MSFNSLEKKVQGEGHSKAYAAGVAGKVKKEMGKKGELTKSGKSKLKGKKRGK